MAEYPIVARSLSRRELEVLKEVHEGLSVSAIADKLFVEIRTVNFHLGNIYRKLGVHKKKDALVEATRQGYF
jgi:DNA-binding CsgD family transcriptional regulator